MVLGRKTNFFLEKTKKTIFLEFGRIVSQKMVFLVFPRKKLVFLPKAIFFLGKSWFSRPKPFFFLGKSWFSRPKPSFPRENQKKHLFGV